MFGTPNQYVLAKSEQVKVATVIPFNAQRKLMNVVPQFSE